MEMETLLILFASLYVCGGVMYFHVLKDENGLQPRKRMLVAIFYPIICVCIIPYKMFMALVFNED